MNSDNLKGKGFESRTTEEARELARKGGQASGRARRKKADLRAAMQDLLNGIYDSESGEKISGTEALATKIFQNALDDESKQWSDAVKFAMQLVNATRTKEQEEREKAEIKLLKAQVKQLEAETASVNTAIYNGIPAAMIAPVYQSVYFDILSENHSEYVFKGGRGSLKSSFVSEMIVDILMRYPEMHALVCRKVGNTLKDSVYAQIKWAIQMLGLENDFTYKTSPMEIIRKKTGQKIFFRGADDPLKIKSIKPEFGYIGVLWFEELDQYNGEEEIRSITQSAIRGGDLAFTFKSFNPPKTVNSWANQYVLVPDDRRLTSHMTYLDAPAKWLGQQFIDDAEFLKEINPVAYENEYLGEANGTGGSVFDNVELREITDEEIAHFDNIYNGVDWGWFPDPFAFVRVHYDAARLTLYIWQEYTCNKKSNRETADALFSLGITGGDVVTCDSAENKSVSDYREFGINARGAEKGAGSREYSYKWLQSLVKIVIDHKRCSVAADEFLHYEYDRDKEGNVITGYPDGDDHCIDAVRYALERVWKRKGQ